MHLDELRQMCDTAQTAGGDVTAQSFNQDSREMCIAHPMWHGRRRLIMFH